jgi:ribosomal 50S subunit-recycling heat shock protein
LRLDQFLRNTGLIVRRTVAKTACDESLVELNGKAAKPAAEVRVGDRLTLKLGLRISEYEVLQVPLRPVPKATREDYAKLLRTEKREVEL